MSDCHNPATLSFCKHGCPVKFGCMACEEEKQFFDKMDKRYDDNKANPELLMHRINYLFKEQIRLISNETKIWKGCDELDKRIAKLEQVKITLKSHAMDTINRRLRELEETRAKKPHKCPVCDGLGINCIVGEIRSLPIKSERCHCCEGKGVLWG